VSEVAEIPDADIEPPPSFGAKLRSDFITGMGKIDERFVILLDVSRCSRSKSCRLWATSRRRRAGAGSPVAEGARG